MTDTNPCQRAFDEELLSGYIDGELSQGERQRIEVHLAECASCRTLQESMRAVRDAARSTAFAVPTDEQWRETARTLPGRWSRQLGWLFVILCAAAGAGILLWEAAASPEPWWVKVTVFGVLGGVGLLFASVLMDRLHDRRHDRYRRVHK